MKRKEYIDADSVMDALAEYFGNYAAVPLLTLTAIKYCELHFLLKDAGGGEA